MAQTGVNDGHLMRSISKLRGRIRRRVRRNRDQLKRHYGHDREKQFRAANLLTTIWWTNSIIFTLLACFMCLPSELLDVRAKTIFSVVLLIIGAMFVGCYRMVLNNHFMMARRIIVGGSFFATALSTLLTGGFPASVTTSTMLIPIILTYCTYGGKVSHISTALTVVFLVSQMVLSKAFGLSFPDLASHANDQLNYVLVLATTFAIVIMAMISLDISTQTYVKRADRAAESKSNFLANMSHELRTPLNGVIGLTDVMLKTQLDTNQQVYMDAIDVSGKSLFSIITDILDFSKIESGYVEVKRDRFNLRESLDALIAETAEGMDNPDVKLHLFFPKDCPETLIGDQGKLEQILRKLLCNAVKFTSEGYVSLKASVIQDTKVARLKLEVQDTGLGISKTQRKQIFDQFTQGESSTTKRYGGTGLGLAITKRLVELMNGEIGVKSKLGEGSTFWFEVDTEVVDAKAAKPKTQTVKKEDTPPLPATENSPPREKSLLVTTRPEICETLFADISNGTNRVFTAPPSQQTLDFINGSGFQDDWSRTLFLDDVSDMEAANAFLASLQNTQMFGNMSVARVSSLQRKDAGDVRAVEVRRSA